MDLSTVINKLLNHLHLQSELDDFEKVHQSIEKDVVFKGTNLWILIFAILVASVGLNMNSTAVIIGAMLISPLMGPINGLGYSIATYNFDLLKKSAFNLIFAIGAGLLTSTIYFSVTPISTAHSELLARTSPTIYDVVIAFFGGLAGIVAISSKQKGNVIPGVAIATALMPPLCTAGYGLATSQYYYFFGAFYLFTINTVFIAMASLLVSQLIKFPIRASIENKHKVKINRIISSVIVIVLIPSIYFGYVLVQQERFLTNAAKYVEYVSNVEGNFLLKQEIKPKNRSILLIYGGKNFEIEEKEEIIAKALLFSLKDTKIEIQQGISFEETISETKLNETQQLYKGKYILEEINAIYPQISGCAVAETFNFIDSVADFSKVNIVVFSLEEESRLMLHEKNKIEEWLNVKLKTENVKVFYEQEKE